MNSTADRIAVIPVEVAFQGLRLPDGQILSVELARPQRRWAIAVHEADGSVSIASVHDTETTAEQAASWLRRELEGRGHAGACQ